MSGEFIYESQARLFEKEAVLNKKSNTNYRASEDIIYSKEDVFKVDDDEVLMLIEQNK